MLTLLANHMPAVTFLILFGLFAAVVMVLEYMEYRIAHGYGGNLRRMMEEMEMVGSDLKFRDQIAAPTVKVSSMSVAGK